MDVPGEGRIAVVVITRNRPRRLEATLDRLVALPERPPVLVVDNGSDPGVVAALRSAYRDAGHVDWIPLPANEGSAGRTVGVRRAATEYVAFADDDSWWEPGALPRAAAMMDADPAVGMLAAAVVVAPGRRADPVSAAMSAGPLDQSLSPGDTGPRAVVGCLACSAVVRSRAYLASGGFAPAMMVGGEEQILVWDLWAAGWKALYAPEVTAVHDPAPGRDAVGRRAATVRNDLWSAWARLPLRAASSATASVLASPGPLRGGGEALRSVRWPLARRAALPARVEHARRLLAARG